MSFAQHRIKKEIERGLTAEAVKYDDTQLLLEVCISGLIHEFRFSDKYPFHAPAVVCAGEYSNLRMLWPEVWKATYTINNIIQALTTGEPETED